MHKKAFGEPSPAWGAYGTPADFLHGFKEVASQQGRTGKGQKVGREEGPSPLTINSWICHCFKGLEWTVGLVAKHSDSGRVQDCS